MGLHLSGRRFPIAAVHFLGAFDEDIGILSTEFINDTEEVEITHLWVDSLKNNLNEMEKKMKQGDIT